MGAAASAVGYHASEDHVHKGHATTIREKLDELSSLHLPEEEFHREMKHFFLSLHPPDWQHPELKEQTVHSTHHHHAQVHHQHMSHSAHVAESSALKPEERHALEEQIKEANKKRHEGEHAHNHKEDEDKSHHHHHHHHNHDGAEEGAVDVKKDIAADPLQEGVQPSSEE